MVVGGVRGAGTVARSIVLGSKNQDHTLTNFFAVICRDTLSLGTDYEGAFFFRGRETDYTSACGRAAWAYIWACRKRRKVMK